MTSVTSDDAEQSPSTSTRTYGGVVSGFRLWDLGFREWGGSDHGIFATILTEFAKVLL